MGLIPGAEFPGFLRAATVFVIPHPAVDFSAAAFPSKSGECLASGTPVVVTLVGEVEVEELRAKRLRSGVGIWRAGL